MAHGITVGQEIGIRCTVQPGPFSEERLISFETVDGPVSGFVNEERDLKKGGEKWFVRAEVLAIRDDILEVKVQGSFFTTNGVAEISRSTAMAA